MEQILPGMAEYDEWSPLQFWGSVEKKSYCIRSSYGGVSKITVGISSADQEVGLLAKVGTGTELEIGIRLRKNERKMPSRSFSLTIKTCLTRRNGE